MLTIAVATALAYFVTVFVLAPGSLGYSAMMRYTVPIFLAGFASVSLLISKDVGAHSVPRGTARLWLAFLMLLSLSFLPSACNRFEQGQTLGSTHGVKGWVTAPEYRVEQAFYLDARGASVAHAAQNALPPSEKIVVWSHFLAQFDFRRNAIADFDPWALVVPGLTHPPLDDPDAWRKWLTGTMGIRYVIWQHKGYPIQSRERVMDMLKSPIPLERAYAWSIVNFRAILDELKDASGIVYADEYHYVIDLTAGPSK